MTQEHKNLHSGPYPHQGIDRSQAQAQLEILGYQQGEDIVYPRAIVPGSDPRKGTQAQARNLKGLKWAEIERFNQDGYGIYFVVNGGGHSDKDVTHCRAVFCEFDDRPIVDQINFWQELGLPEPSLQIATRKSVHTYWVFDQPIPVSQWRELQTALLTVAGSDQSLKNPSRVMRLAGAYHIKPGCDPLRCDIIHQSGKRYSYEELCAAIPMPQPAALPQLQPLPQQEPESQPVTVTPTYQRYEDIQVPVPQSVPLEVCLSKESRALLESGVSSGGRNTGGAKLARDLIGAANYLQSIGQRFHSDPRRMLSEYASLCTPPLPAKEVDGIWKSAEKDRPGPSCTPDGVEACVRAWYWNNHVKPNQTATPRFFLDITGHPYTTQIIYGAKPTTQKGCPVMSGDFVTPNKSGSGSESFSGGSRSGGGSGSGSGSGFGGDNPTMFGTILCQQIKEILQAFDSQSMRDAALMDLAAAVGRNFRELEQLAKILLLETDESDDVAAAGQSLGKLLKTRRTSLDPHDYFEGWFAQKLQATADAMPTAVEFLITTLLPVAAACIGTSSRIIVKPQGGYVQALVIWSAIVGQSGGLKTPAQKAIIKPLMALEALYYQEYQEALKAYKEQTTCRQANPEQFDGEPEPVAPVRKRLVTKDCTLEKLQRIHGDNPRGLLYYRDELAGGAKSRNQYRGGFGADYEAELDQFNGAEIIYDRGDKEVFLSSSCICRTGGYQWEVAAQMMDENGDFTGMNARWLLDAAKAPKPYIDLLSKDADTDTGLSDALMRLYSALRKVPDRDYLLSYEAKVLFQAFQHQSVDEGEAEEKFGLQVVYPKNQSYVARLALLLHIVNAILRSEIPEPVIGGETMRQAIDLAGYYLWQYRMIYKHNNPDSGLEGLGLKIHRYAQRIGRVTASAVKRGVAAFRKVVTGTIRSCFESLAASGWGHIEGSGAEMVYIPNSELNKAVDTVDGLLIKKSTAVTRPPSDFEPEVDKIDGIDKSSIASGSHQSKSPDNPHQAGKVEEDVRENHQFINSESLEPVEQGLEPVDGDVQPDHQLSTESELNDDDPSVRDARNLLSEEEMAAWHQRLNSCQTLDDVSDFFTSLDTLAPLQRQQFEFSVSQECWDWLLALPEVQESVPTTEPELEPDTLKVEQTLEPTLEELKALLLACDSLGKLQELKRKHKQSIATAYNSMSQNEQVIVDGLAALAVPHKVFKYLGDTIVQGTERLLRGALVYVDPQAQLRTTAYTAPVWAINGVASGWKRPISVSVSLLQEVVKVVLPDELGGSQQMGLISNPVDCP